MPNERENFIAPLTSAEFDIAGNSFRAYYDADGKLVFVLDTTKTQLKPNALLVINPVGNRKWDDILMNDYGVDLETVRPKKDNKYQKLDIEYAGLSDYDNLIQAYNDDADLSGVLAKLAAFKTTAAMRAANERKSAAEDTISKTRVTIEKTNETIDELQARLKSLRSKLTAQRREIGKEPTKQSAAKILRTESLIDATNAKLARARKRLDNAQNRIAIAEEEIEVANNILALAQETNTDYLPTQPITTDVTVVDEAPVPMETAPQFTEIIPAQTQEQKAEDMADEEVQPLFDKDPEILDEGIAFKPIDFDTPATIAPTPVMPVENTNLEPVPAQPLSFTPPATETPAQSDFQPISAPVLDTITSVETPTETVIEENWMPEPVASNMPVQPVPEPIQQTTEVRPAPVNPVADITPATPASDFRPVSPITGDSVAPLTPVQHKPNIIYYVLLIILIVLSIFTLWLYQKSTNDTVPELGANTTVQSVEQPADNAEKSENNPFIEPEPTTITTQEAVEAAPVETVTVETMDEEQPQQNGPEVVIGEVETVPVTPANVDVPVAQAVVETVPVTPDVPETPVAVTPTVPTVSPFLDEEPVVIPTEEEILARKPSYNVSQQEKMFVADEEYKTDQPVITTEETVVQEEVDVCSDGNAPDEDGCCTGETLTDMGGGEYACCANGTNECFPPML